MFLYSKSEVKVACPYIQIQRSKMHALVFKSEVKVACPCILQSIYISSIATSPPISYYKTLPGHSSKHVYYVWGGTKYEAYKLAS